MLCYNQSVFQLLLLTDFICPPLEKQCTAVSRKQPKVQSKRPEGRVSKARSLWGLRKASRMVFEIIAKETADREMKRERVREHWKNRRSRVLVTRHIPVSARAAPGQAHALPRRRTAWAQAKATVSHLRAFRAPPQSVFSEDRRNSADRRKP